MWRFAGGQTLLKKKKERKDIFLCAERNISETVETVEQGALRGKMGGSKGN